MFAKCGEVTDLFVVNKDTFSFAFVTYADSEGAKQAIEQ
jgi:hypothetical protein